MDEEYNEYGTYEDDLENHELNELARDNEWSYDDRDGIDGPDFLPYDEE